MIVYILYKLANMKRDALYIITSNISKSHTKLKIRLAIDIASWLHYWGMIEYDALQNINIINNIIITRVCTT
jgi:hypothetical protein